MKKWVNFSLLYGSGVMKICVFSRWLPNEPHGTLVDLGNIKNSYLNTIRVPKSCQAGAWEPILPALLKRYGRTVHILSLIMSRF